MYAPVPQMVTLDPDLLRTFVAIADCGSFARAADRVGRTQSAVSMQMKRLEQTVGRPLFIRVGRNNVLTGDGENLLDFAIRILRLHDEAAQSLTSPLLSGHVRLGTPDDYADRFLPPILARFARTHPRVDLSVRCLDSLSLAEAIAKNELDLAIVTQVEGASHAEVIRREQLHWVGSLRHKAHLEEVVPLALGPVSCAWRLVAEAALDRTDCRYRVVYTTWNASAIAATVLSGLAISVLPESALRAGMSILATDDRFPPLPACNIALLRGANAHLDPVSALGDHIAELLDNFAERSSGRSTEQISAA
jgi:DNA-binding transcriptional LysR family regulator